MRISSSTSCEILQSFVGCILVTGALGGVVTMMMQDVDRKGVPIVYYLSMVVATYILGIKVLGVILQGPEMKKLIVKTTDVEGSFESSFRALLIAYFWLRTGCWDSAMVSSLVMIGKAGAENLLMFGDVNKLDDFSLVKRLCLLVKYIPVFTLTSIFRLGTVICVINTTFPVGVPILLFLSVVLPFLILVSSKCCYLPDLSVSDLARGVGAEFSSLTLWGQRGREGSRKIQLFMGIYFNLLYAPILLYVIYSQELINSALLSLNVTLVENPILLGGPFVFDPALLNHCAIAFLFSGIISFLLFIYQIYFMEKYNILSKLKTLSISSSHC